MYIYIKIYIYIYTNMCVCSYCYNVGIMAKLSGYKLTPLKPTQCHRPDMASPFGCFLSKTSWEKTLPSSPKQL